MKWGKNLIYGIIAAIIAFGLSKISGISIEKSILISIGVLIGTLVFDFITKSN